MISITVTSACRVSVCLFVCMFVCLLTYLKTRCPNWCPIGCDSVLFWWQCNKFCTSGSMDDVMFSHNGANGPVSKTTLHSFVEFARCWQQLDVRQRYVWWSSPDGSTKDEVASTVSGLLRTESLRPYVCNIILQFCNCHFNRNLVVTGST